MTMPSKTNARTVPARPIESAEFDGQGGFKVTRRVSYIIEMPAGAMDALAEVVGTPADAQLAPHQRRVRRDFIEAAEAIRFDEPA